MTFRRPWMWGATAGFLLLALLSRGAAGDDSGPSDVPSGMVAFFANDSGTCPQGWRVATEAAGRLVVGVASGDTVGKLVGQPLDNQEDRTHVHAFSTSVDLPYKSISALDGSNNQGAAAKTYVDSGTTEAASSGMPFVQLVACVKP